MSTTSRVGRAYPAQAGARERSSLLAAPLLVVVAFVVVCVPLAYYLNIWQDEAYSLRSSSGGLAEALRRGLGFEAQAPLYFALLAAWRDLNPSAFFARLLSIAFSVVTLATTWAFARRYIAGVKATIVVAAVAVNPFTIWAAIEIRPYAASITCSVLLLFLFFRGFVDERASRAARIGYLCVAILGCYTQYYVAFLIAAHAFALLMLREWLAAGRLIVYGAAICLSLVPLGLVLPGQFESYSAFAAAFAIPGYAMLTVLLGYPFPHGWIETWAHLRLLNALYLAVAFVPLGLGAGHVAPSRTTKALGYVLVALFALYTLVIVGTHVQVLVPRHTLVMLVPLLAFAASLIGDVALPRRRLVLATYAAVYTLFAALTLWHAYHGLSKPGDWRRVSEFVTARARPADGVALFNAEADVPFRYYFRAPLPVFAIPRPMSFERFDESAFVLHGTACGSSRTALARRRITPSSAAVISRDTWRRTTGSSR